ncbi:MAG: 30S ribosomal protein S6 [Anaerolineales bacterium]|nr:30S ribosomal protein S6 [Anaerolineales bacterium]
MRVYELIYIVHPDLDEEAFSGTQERVKGWISAAGGSVVKEDLWGKRKLAYPIRKQNEGQYVYLDIQVEPEFCPELERQLRLQESVMRFSIVMKE